MIKYLQRIESYSISDKIISTIFFIIISTITLKLGYLHQFLKYIVHNSWITIPEILRELCVGLYNQAL